MSVKLLTEHHLEFLSLEGCCGGSSESTLVKMPHCWKSRVTADIVSLILIGVCMMMLKPYEDVIRHPEITPICEDNV